MVEQLRALGEAPDVLDLLDRVYVIDQGTEPGRRTTRTSPTRPRSSATGCRSSSRATSAAPAGSPAAMDETVRAGRERLRAAHGRRRPARARGHPARGHLRRPGPPAHDRRRPHVQHVRPLGAARVRRDHRPAQLVVGRRAEHQGPARLRAAEPAQHAVAAPPRRRRLQRLVDVPDPDAGHRASSACRCRSSSSGTTPSTGCGPASTASRRCRCRAWRRGTSRGTDKNDALDWQAYYHLRNRLVTALLHSPRPSGGAAHLREPASGSCRTCCPCSTRPPRCGCWRSRTCWPAPGTCTASSGPRWRSCGSCARRITDAQAAADLESFPPPRRKAPDELKAVHHARPTRSTC